MGPKLQNYFEEHQITHKMLKSNQKASTAERVGFILLIIMLVISSFSSDDS